MNEVSLCTKILAKSREREETLKEHTERALFFLLKWFDWQKANIKKISDVAGISDDQLISRIFAMVYLHDIGKASLGFQHYVRGGPRSTPHALLSLPFILGAIPPIGRVHHEALAVISHHTPFHAELYSQYRNMALKDRYCLDEARRFYLQLPSVHKEKIHRPYPFPLKDLNMTTAGVLLSKVKELYLVPPKTRPIISFFTAALHYGDWLASGNLEDYEYSLKQIREPLQKVMAKREEFSWYDYQRKVGDVQGNVFIRIPTGKGKTEAALLWADRNLLGGKLIYLLPTRVTSNAMYKRMSNFFHENVGISHGTAALIIAEEKGWGTSEYISKKLLSSTFMQPLTVATVDQLLLAKFNWHHWELMEQNCARSLIIFDEIHSYDTYTIALIFNAVKELKDYGARFAFMSATFPNYVKEGLEEILGKTTLIQEKKYDRECRHRINYISSPIEDAIPLVIRHYKEGKKVLVIVNTVKKSVEVYKVLKKSGVRGKDILLYHSRFIEMDRRRKEKTIEDGAKRVRGFIAVTTQVVEVSLDIDYDLLYTELAPVDALAQRMGRVNRRGTKGNVAGIKGIVNIFIYEPSDESQLVYGKENLDRAHMIIEEANGINLTERDLKTLVERQYPKEPMLRKLTEELKTVQDDLKRIRLNLWYIQTLQLSDEWEALRKATTRREKLPSIEVIPICFKNEVENLAHPTEIINYTVRVLLHTVANYLEASKEKRGRLFAHVKYNSEYGVGARQLNEFGAVNNII